MTRELKATHQCTICGARWRECDDFRWTLRSKECGPCCDNVAMGDQIEALEDVAPWSGSLTADETAMIDDAWKSHEAAIPELLSAIYQYRSDLRYPPSPGSIERRLEMIDAVIAKAGVA